MALPEGHGGVDTPADASNYEVLPTSHEADEIPLSGSSSLPIITGPSPPISPKPHHPIGNGHPPVYPARASFESRPSLSQARKTSRSPLLDPFTLTPASGEEEDVTVSPYRRYSHDEPPVLPTALHSNFITSCIGFATLVMLWIPMVPLHWTGVETFRMPGATEGDSSAIWFDLAIVAACGAIYVSLSD